VNPIDTTPEGVPAQLEEVRERPFPFLLESAMPDPRWGRFSYSGSDPTAILLGKGDALELWKGGAQRTWTGDPWEALAEFLQAKLFAVGWLGYDLGRFLEKLPRRAQDDLGFPDLFFAAYDGVSVVDHGTGMRHRPERISRAAAVDPSAYRERFLGLRRPPRATNTTKSDYLRAIARAKEYIAAGDIYQVNLSQRFEVTGPPPAETYARLRKISPAPYAAYLECGARAFLSSSPEQFLEIRGRRVLTRPIKGTRPRGRDEDEDRRLRRELEASPKDDAELAMIVDLERNDLGRVCEYGSVVVEEPKVLETHPTVHHLSATIAGRLRPGLGPVEVLRATFPGGSVTGAPKIRAMEIIDELEPTRRGVYTGAFGYIAPDGSMNLAVAIRSLHYDSGRYGFQVGGAIVADSDPEAEYEETLVKASGMARALGIPWTTNR